MMLSLTMSCLFILLPVSLPLPPALHLSWPHMVSLHLPLSLCLSALPPSLKPSEALTLTRSLFPLFPFISGAREPKVHCFGV